jgi:hypothetical protein
MNVRKAKRGVIWTVSYLGKRIELRRDTPEAKSAASDCGYKRCVSRIRGQRPRLQFESKKFVTVLYFIVSIISMRALARAFLQGTRKESQTRRCETYLWISKLRLKLGDFAGCAAGRQDCGCG